MNNEIATTKTDESGQLELLPPAQAPSLAARAMLISHAEMMHTAYELADSMCRTAMVPDRFRNKPDDAAAAILYGAELGLNPIQSLQRVIPIYGMPTLEARTMVALLKARGYKIRTAAATDESVTVTGIDLDGQTYESTWTMARAIKAGYVPQIDEKTGKYRTNAKGNLIGNEKYLTDPRAMLKAKGQAEVCRDMAPDVLLGIAYSSEELASEQFDHRPNTAPTARSAPITVEEIFADDQSSSAGLATDKSGGEPSVAHDGPPPAEEPPGDVVADEPPTPAMNRKMHALFRDVGLTDRQDRLIVTGEILGYSLETSGNLTRGEATKLIDTLEAWLGPEATIGAEARITEILQTWAARQTEEQDPE